MKRLLLFGLLLTCAPASVMAQLAGTDSAPGSSCAGYPQGATTMTADADDDGAEVILICNGTTWEAETSAAAGTDRRIQFNSGGVLSTDANFVLSNTGALGVATANPAAKLDVAGEIKFSSSGLTCSSTVTGAIRFVSAGATDPYQYCDGSSWLPFERAASGGCTAPASCPDVGDVCSDGSLFAGFRVYGSSCEALYVTNNNQSASVQWKTATGTNDITNPTDKYDSVDGRYNRDNRGSGTFPAFELCENNTYHGKSDWYLPARDELHLLWENQAAIDANAAGNFTTSTYWSSTEVDTTTVRTQNFTTGNHNNGTKNLNAGVRCVRRD